MLIFFVSIFCFLACKAESYNIKPYYPDPITFNAFNNFSSGSILSNNNLKRIANIKNNKNFTKIVKLILKDEKKYLDQIISLAESNDLNMSQYPAIKESLISLIYANSSDKVIKWMYPHLFNNGASITKILSVISLRMLQHEDIILSILYPTLHKVHSGSRLAMIFQNITDNSFTKNLISFIENKANGRNSNDKLRSTKVQPSFKSVVYN